MIFLEMNNILHEKRYERNMIKYIRTLTDVIQTNEKRDKIRQDTLKAVIIGNAVFLKIMCIDCGCRMVDPAGVKSMRFARCGNCGFSLTIPYNHSHITLDI